MCRILMTSASFRPEYGGPAVSVPQLACAMVRHGFEIILWAPDGTAGQALGARLSDGVIVSFGDISEVISRSKKIDIVHDNGIWLPHNHALARMAREKHIPRIVSPRGMLEPWARSHRAWKKRLAWFLYQRRDLNAAALIHCTSEQEAINVTALGLGVDNVVVPNGIHRRKDRVLSGSSINSGLGSSVRLNGCTRRVVFLSRLHPKKGILMLLKAWSTLSLAGWELHIAGIPEDGYDLIVKDRIAKLGLTATVKYVGPLFGEDKDAFITSAQVFVLPSYSENFGMVVAESLSLGVPVLTTTGTPWHHLEQFRCGWLVEPTESGLRDGLLRATSIDDSERNEMGARGIELIHDRFNWEGISNSMATVYTELLRRLN